MSCPFWEPLGMRRGAHTAISCLNYNNMNEGKNIIRKKLQKKLKNTPLNIVQCIDCIIIKFSRMQNMHCTYKTQEIEASKLDINTYTYIIDFMYKINICIKSIFQIFFLRLIHLGCLDIDSTNFMYIKKNKYFFTMNNFQLYEFYIF